MRIGIDRLVDLRTFAPSISASDEDPDDEKNQVSLVPPQTFLRWLFEALARKRGRSPLPSSRADQ